MNASHPITSDTRLILRFEGEARPTTMGLFATDNAGGDLELAEIRRALARGEVYRSGGGANPAWSVELAT